VSWFGKEHFMAFIFQLISYHANDTALPEPGTRNLAHARTQEKEEPRKTGSRTEKRTHHTVLARQTTDIQSMN